MRQLKRSVVVLRVLYRLLDARWVVQFEKNTQKEEKVENPCYTVCIKDLNKLNLAMVVWF